MTEVINAQVGDESVGESVQASGQQLNGGAVNKEGDANGALQRVLSEKKKEQAQRRELESRLQLLEQEKLEAEGKKEELIKALRTQVKDLSVKLNETKATYAERVVRDQIGLRAKELGCLDSDLLTKAINFDTLEVNEDNFSVDPQSLEAQLEGIRKTKPFLFKSVGPAIRDGVPSKSGSTSGAGLDLSKMTTEQLKEYAMKNLK
jgi:hypothetical protein